MTVAAQPSPAHCLRQGRAASRKPAAGLWLRYLPDIWRDAVDVPLTIAHHREYEMDATRSVGYDADDRPCFTAHHFVLTVTAATPEGPREEPAYCEEMAAWRLHDERWLVFRIISASTGVLPRGFYAISPHMPR